MRAWEGVREGKMGKDEGKDEGDKTEGFLIFNAENYSREMA